MSYQVLARKWRPRAFTEMVGQEHVLRALINGLDNDRLHHAYLFTGTRGVGKTTLARILAKCLNCETGVSSIPCNQCGSCREIAEGRFVDLIEVDAASRTKVEDTRELLENVQYAPTRGRYKVYLIDEVHMLSNHSFNALLKTLEEPPPHVKFLLATTDPQKLPVTILSRCMQFNLKNLNPERIVGHLKHVLGEEKIPYEEAALWELGRSADGSMRDALSLTDQAIAHGGGTLTTAEVNAMLGTIDRTSVVEICQAVAAADAQRAMAGVEHMAEHAPDYGAALAEMLSIWHQVAIGQTVPDALDPVQEHHQVVLELARILSREVVQLLYQITLLGRKDLPYAADARSGFEMVLLRLLAFRPLFPEQAQMPGASGPVAVKREGGPVPEAATPAKKPEFSPPPVAAAVPQSRPEPPPVAQKSPNKESEIPVLGPAPIPQPTPISAGNSASAPVRSGEAPSRPVAAVRMDTPPPAAPSVDMDLPDDDDDSTLASYESYLASAPDSGNAPAPAPKDVTPRIETDVPALISTPPTAERIPLNSLNPENWHKVCENLGQGGLLQNTALNMVLESVQDHGLQFLLDRDNSALYDDSQRERLAAALSDYFGEKITLSIRVAQVSQETPRRITERLRAERLQQAIDSLKADPHVQQLVQVFGAQLVESSVKPID